MTDVRPASARPVPPPPPPLEGPAPSPSRERGVAVPEAVSVLLVALAAGAAGMVFALAFGAGPLWKPVVAAAFAPALTVIVLRMVARPGGATTFLACLVVGVVVLGVTVFASTISGGILPTADTFRAAGDALRNGWARLLSTSLPADALPSLLFVPFTLVWLASWLGIELATRTRTTVVPGLPAVVALGLGFAFGVPGTGSTLVPAAVLVIAVAGLAMVRASTTGPRTTTGTLAPDLGRRLIAGIPLLVMLAVGAPLVASHLPGPSGRHRYDPREHRHVAPPTQPAVSPLSQLKARLLDPGRVLFTFRASGPLPTRITQVVLDRYDGASWSANASYVSAGHRLPTKAAAGVPTRRVNLDVTLKQLDGIWLPAPAKPVAIDGSRFAFDPAHDVLVSKARSLRGFHYRVTSEVPQPTVIQLQSAPAGANRADTRLPRGLPDTLAQAAITFTANASSPAQRARALAAGLRKQFRLPKRMAQAPTGQSYADLAYLFNPRQGDYLGTPEQFATALAVMARSVGLPARVVAGFTTPAPSADGLYRVRSGDATAWVEIELHGVGWVAFDANPTRTSSSRRAPQRQKSLPDAAQRVPPSSPKHGQHGHAPAPVHHASRAGVAWWVWPALAAGGLAGVGIIALLAIGLVKQRRHRRRRLAGDANQRVLGAWHEAEDRLVEARVPLQPDLAATEVARLATTTLGVARAKPLLPLGTLVNRSLYRRGGAGSTEADQAWGLVDQLGDALAHGTPRRERWRRALSPRSLHRR